MKKTFAGALRLLAWDWPSLLLFELLYKFLLLLLAGPGYRLLDFALREAGIIRLTGHELPRLLGSPAALLILLLLAAAAALCVYVEMAVVVLYCEHGVRGEPVGALRLLREAAARALGSLCPRTLPVLGFVLLAAPVSGLVLTAGPLHALRLPGFVMDYIRHEWTLHIAYRLVMTALELLLLRWIFCIHETVLHGAGFLDACRTSGRLLRGRVWKTIGLLAGWRLLTSAVMAAAYYGAALLLLLAVRLAAAPEEALRAFWFQFSILRAEGQVLSAILSAACSFGLITALYYRYHMADPLRLPRGARGGRHRLLKCLLAILLLGLYTQTTAWEFFDHSVSGGAKVVAHRAGALYAPENTIAALREAIRSGADYAEIDVQQTLDGELIVLHDTNFKRTAGVDANVWDTTLARVRLLDVGGPGPSRFSGERIPTLGEMLREAKGKIGLMIELKNSGHGGGLTAAAIELVKRYGMEDECIISSMDYRILEESKRLCPRLRTAYIAMLAYGDFGGMDAADLYSVQATFVTPGLSSHLAGLGKPVYVWTINDERTMRGMAGLQIEGLITDNPYLAAYILDTGGRDVFVGELVQHILLDG